MAIKIKQDTDKRIRIPTDEAQDKRLHTLPQWVQRRLAAQEREITALTALVKEMSGERGEGDLSYREVRAVTLRSSDIYLPKHVLQVSAFVGTERQIDMRVTMKDNNPESKIVSISAGGIGRNGMLEILPRAANLVYVR